MAPRQRAAGLLLPLLGWRACAGLYGIEEIQREIEWPKKPGQRGYWVNLLSLSPSSGALQPEFIPDLYKYELVVSDAEATFVQLFFSFDATKYTAEGFPAVKIDGHSFTIDLLQDTQAYTVWLNETDAPFDRTVQIQVFDPKASTGGLRQRVASLFAHSDTSQTYSVHIRQPPNVVGILRARRIQVLDKTGAEIWPSPPFDPTSAHTEYAYHLEENQTTVTIRVECSSLVTGISINGGPPSRREWPRWAWARGSRTASSDVTITGTYQEVPVELHYNDTVWLEEERKISYLLRIRRELTVTDVPIQVRMLPTDGECARRETNGTVHLDCRSMVPRPRLVGSFDSEGRAVLVAQAGGAETPMFVGIPLDVPVPEEGAKFTLRVLGGRDGAEAEIEVRRAARCTAMACPRDHLRRVGAEHKLCMSDPCSVDTDLAACCVEAPKCDSLRRCPTGLFMRPEAARLHCRGYACDARTDGGMCCGRHAACSAFGFECGSRMVLRPDADAVACRGFACTERDAGRCCVVDRAAEAQQALEWQRAEAERIATAAAASAARAEARHIASGVAGVRSTPGGLAALRRRAFREAKRVAYRAALPEALAALRRGAGGSGCRGGPCAAARPASNRSRADVVPGGAGGGAAEEEAAVEAATRAARRAIGEAEAEVKDSAMEVAAKSATELQREEAERIAAEATGGQWPLDDSAAPQNVTNVTRAAAYRAALKEALQSLRRYGASSECVGALCTSHPLLAPGTTANGTAAARAAVDKLETAVKDARAAEVAADQAVQVAALLAAAAEQQAANFTEARQAAEAEAGQAAEELAERKAALETAREELERQTEAEAREKAVALPPETAAVLKTVAQGAIRVAAQAEARERVRQQLLAAEREKVDFYRRVGCSPVSGGLCAGFPCYYDELCSPASPDHIALGCMAGGLDYRCRFCGFGQYSPCPNTPNCSAPNCDTWNPADLAWCKEKLSLFCEGTDLQLYAVARGDDKAMARPPSAGTGFVGWLVGLGVAGSALAQAVALCVQSAGAQRHRYRPLRCRAAAPRSPPRGSDAEDGRLLAGSRQAGG